MKFPSRIPIYHVISFIAIALLSTICAISGAPFSKADLSLVKQIEANTGLLVEADSLKWITSSAPAQTPVSSGSDLVFLGRNAPGAPRDLYLTRCRVSPANRLISLSDPVNLTRSDAADDYLLRTDLRHVCVATRAMKEISSITCFNLSGQPLPDDGSWSAPQRLMARINDWQRTDRFAGIDRRSVRFAASPKTLDFDFLRDDNSLSLILEYTEPEGRRRVAEIRLDGADLSRDGLTLSSEVRLPKRTVLWLVDSVRAIPAIGPGPIEWAEGRFFAVKDRYRQIAFSVLGESDDGDFAAPVEAPPAPLRLPEGIEIGDSAPLEWPPKELGPIAFKNKKKDEGIWYPALPDFVPTIPGAPPSMYRTYVRPDAQRSYARVALVAMDTRQLELHMVGGHEDPRSTTGQVGSGRIPRDPAVLNRVVAAFNGAFKTEHGGYGMMEDRTVLLPPLKNAASIATWRDGRVSLGAWPDPPTIPEQMTSYRQNMDPLLEDGVVNPRRRYLWGFTLGSDLSNMNTIRSGICVRPDGILIYAWGEDATAVTLGEAMKSAGCEFGMHLDMNPLHTAFIAYGFEPTEKNRQPVYNAKILYPGMRFSTGRYVNGSPKDFFYVTLRTLTPGPEWQHENLSQPRPAFLPSIFRINRGEVRGAAINSRNVQANRIEGQIATDTSGDTALDEKDLHSLLVEFLPGNPDEDTASPGGSLILTREGTTDISPGRVGSALHGTVFPVDDAVATGSEKVFVAAVVNNWILFLQGPADEVQRTLQSAGVPSGKAISYRSGTLAPTVLLRTSSGMEDLSGIRINTRDMKRTGIRFSATPAPTYAGRLKF